MRIVDATAPAVRARSFDLEPYLSTAALGRTLEVHASLPSTNARGLELARHGARHGATVVALEQTEGRGQRGHRWHSAAGAGLYASFVLRPALSPRLASAITLVAGVAVQQALATAWGVRAGLRWPNDVLALGDGSGPPRKIAGILVEASADQTHLEHAVLGVGLNLAATPLPEALVPVATSVEAECGTAPSPEAALGAIANRLEAALEQMERDGLAPAARDWTQAAIGLGERVELDEGQRVVTGTLLGIAEDGALRLDTPNGRKALYRGELRIPGLPRTPHDF